MVCVAGVVRVRLERVNTNTGVASGNVEETSSKPRLDVLVLVGNFLVGNFLVDDRVVILL